MHNADWQAGSCILVSQSLGEPSWRRWLFPVNLLALDGMKRKKAGMEKKNCVDKNPLELRIPVLGLRLGHIRAVTRVFANVQMLNQSGRNPQTVRE